jgi:hypothetical protein
MPSHEVKAQASVGVVLGVIDQSDALASKRLQSRRERFVHGLELCSGIDERDRVVCGHVPSCRITWLAFIMLPNLPHGERRHEEKT